MARDTVLDVLGRDDIQISPDAPHDLEHIQSRILLRTPSSINTFDIALTKNVLDDLLSPMCVQKREIENRSYMRRLKQQAIKTFAGSNPIIRAAYDGEKTVHRATKQLSNHLAKTGIEKLIGYCPSGAVDTVHNIGVEYLNEAIGGVEHLKRNCMSPANVYANLALMTAGVVSSVYAVVLLGENVAYVAGAIGVASCAELLRRMRSNPYLESVRARARNLDTIIAGIKQTERFR